MIGQLALLLVAASLVAAAQCPGKQSGILPNPADPSQPGPYPVSSLLLDGTFTERNLTVEVFFPAVPGSEVAASNLSIDLRDLLPPSIAAKVPEEMVPHPAYLNAYQRLPPAWQSASSPKGFPLIVFVHGTAGWRSQSLSLVVHWASRGFVVVAADYPGICLHDMLDAVDHPFAKHPKVDQVGDTRLLMAELRAMTDPRLVKLLATPPGAVDVAQNALIGHSAGALALSQLSGEAQVIIPMAGDGSVASPRLANTLILGAQNDSEVPPRWHQYPSFLTTPAPKRLLIGANMGHQAFSDLCFIGEDQGGIAGIGKKCGIWQAYILAGLANDGCSFHDKRFFEPAKYWGLIGFASSAVLEETLRCDGAMPRAFDEIGSRFDFVADVKQQLTEGPLTV